MGETVRTEADLADLVARLMSEIEDVIALIARPIERDTPAAPQAEPSAQAA